MGIQLIVNVINIIQIYQGSMDVIHILPFHPQVSTPIFKRKKALNFKLIIKCRHTKGDLEEPLLLSTQCL